MINPCLFIFKNEINVKFLNLIRMKKTRILFGILAVALVGFITSCEKDEDAVGPSINLIGSGGFIATDQTVEVGTDLPFSWSATKGDAKLTTFWIEMNGNIIPAWNNVEIPNDQSDAYSAADTLEASGTVGTYTYDFIVEDKDGMTDTASVVITTTEAPEDLEEHTVVLLGAQDNTQEPSCASLETGVRYSISGQEAANNSVSVDIIHYNGAKDVALYAPSNTDIQAVSAYGITGWNARNDTKLSTTTLTATEFDNIETDADLDGLGTPDDDFVGFLEVNDVVLFETAGGKRGVFMVTALTDAADGSVTIDIKVEP
jgi:hypothetical protein